MNDSASFLIQAEKHLHEVDQLLTNAPHGHLSVGRKEALIEHLQSAVVAAGSSLRMGEGPLTEQEQALLDMHIRLRELEKQVAHHALALMALNPNREVMSRHSAALLLALRLARYGSSAI